MDWIEIFSTNNEMEINLLQEILEDNNIDSVIVDKTDTMYRFGEFQLNVPTDEALSAKKLIEEYKQSKPIIKNQQ